MFIRGNSHVIGLHLTNTLGNDIEESDGAPTLKISRDNGVYESLTNSPEHIDEDLWTVELTDVESICNEYAIKATHADMDAPYFYLNEAWFTTLTQDEGGAWSMKVLSDIRGAF